MGVKVRLCHVANGGLVGCHIGSVTPAASRSPARQEFGHNSIAQYLLTKGATVVAGKPGAF